MWNPHSSWASRFHDISAFPEDPAWRVSARVEPAAAGRTVSITHHRDPRPVEVPVVAEATFRRDGVRHRLLATSAGPGQAGPLVHFRDLTNGLESYGAGRGLRFQPDGGRAELDFNYAELLPCSFSLAWNCPPPAENALSIAVRAGGRHAVDVAGEPLL